jgi:phosphatidylinositol N-acetylglucosaminyltransferase subunit A
MYTIAMATDFFYPKCGGIESHVLNLSKALARRGHKVIVITRAYGEMRGVKYVDGIKVFYLITQLVPMGASFPSLLGTLPAVREILLREGVEIVHGHQSTSTMALECIVHAKMHSLRTCLTDHSILRPGTAEGVLASTSLQFAVRDCNGLIAVSRPARRNTAVRSGVPCEKIQVIPNAVIPSHFTPDYTRQSDEVVVVVVSRLVFRKGIDLLLEVVPALCMASKEIKFVIAGDGDKRENLEQMREMHRLEGRVEILGDVDCRKVRDVLVRGDILLNTSLTEAFCIALIEAASCGLFVVTTDVGGVREALPEDMARFVRPNKEEIVEGVLESIGRAKGYNKREAHERIRRIYSWDRVAEQTEGVYRGFAEKKYSLEESLREMFYSRERDFSLPFKILLVFEYLLCLLLKRCERCKKDVFKGEGMERGSSGRKGAQ